uniref:ATP-binding cassette sub-family B member 6 n=1 Tax=Cacopsylla melanoneura TaxID=428564 RepID=A0A8D8STF1_9HEMI
MDFCPPNISFVDVWVNHGTSECFMDTVSSSLLALFLLLFGGTQLWMYKKYGIRAREVLPSKLYYLQIFTSILLCLMVALKYVLEATVLYYKTIFIYQIISGACLVFALAFATYLTIMERNYLLPSVPPQGHGLVLLVFWTMLLIFANLTFVNLKRPDWWFQMRTFDDKMEMYMFVVYYSGTLVLFILGLKAPGLSSFRNYYNLNADQSSTSNETQRERSAWTNIAQKVKILAPYLWPRRSARLKVQMMVCFLLLIIARVINVYVPIYNRLLVNSLVDEPLVFRWDYVLILVAFKFLQGGGTGGMGMLNNARSYLWLGVQQYSTREIETEMFSHLHSLSLKWHLSRKTGEVIRVMNRGTDSITNLLNYILFQIAPTMLDIIIAIVYLISTFNTWFGVIVLITMTFYLVATIAITEWRTKFQRQLNLADNTLTGRSIDSLLNFETVKYYGAEQYEINDFRTCIINYQKEEWKTTLSLILLNSTQNIIINVGLLIGSLLCVYQVTEERALTVGDYTLFTTYIMQLYVPLNWFGTYYRAIQKNFVDMEQMFDLLKETSDVVDIPQAPLLCVTQGSVQFRNVCFAYTSERPILKNVSFTVAAGKTLALVGQSGSGKSTIIRLLFRFYNTDSGDIFIDNQNINSVTQASLRQTIGVVPQDTVLFNNTIKFNIRYGRVGASDAEVIDAAKNADIHDRILNFPEKYETQVGERGLKLSGGEKQRVAIARTLLKAPEIVLLDEATSALDTKTERTIQSALNRACANRTTIIVAHRLSTIIHADEILVLHEGQVIERGRHEDLLVKNGVYASMWNQQNTKMTSEGQSSEESSPSAASTVA